MSEPEPGSGRHHRAASGADGGDDLFGVDALQVYGRRAEVGVAELPLDDVEGNAFAGELDCVGVAELMRREASPHTGLESESVKLEPHCGA